MPTYRLYYHDRDYDCLYEAPTLGCLAVLCKRDTGYGPVWTVLQAKYDLPAARVCYVALKDKHGQMEWHCMSEKGAQEVEKSRQDVFVRSLVGLDALDEEYQSALKRARKDQEEWAQAAR